MFENIKSILTGKTKPNKDVKSLETNMEITPYEYFNNIKERKNKVDDVELQRVYDNCLELINKYLITGQKKGIDKLLYHLESIEKERELVKMGIDTFVYKDDIENYIDNIAKDVVKVIELENYEREIPDEIVDVVYAVKEKKLFDRLYVVFTDYTGKIEKEVEKERRDKDPILFGAFYNSRSNVALERFYYLGDWEDEFCHLTLDKMVNETRNKTGKDIAIKFKTPEDIKEYMQQMSQLKANGNSFVYVNNISSSSTNG